MGGADFGGVELPVGGGGGLVGGFGGAGDEEVGFGVLAAVVVLHDGGDGIPFDGPAFGDGEGESVEGVGRLGAGGAGEEEEGAEHTVTGVAESAGKVDRFCLGAAEWYRIQADER